MLADACRGFNGNLPERHHDALRAAIDFHAAGSVLTELAMSAARTGSIAEGGVTDPVGPNADNASPRAPKMSPTPTLVVEGGVSPLA